MLGMVGGIIYSFVQDERNFHRNEFYFFVIDVL